MQEPVLLDMNNIFFYFLLFFSIFPICYFSPFISPISIYEFINLMINLYWAKVSMFSIFIDWKASVVIFKNCGIRDCFTQISWYLLDC